MVELSIDLAVSGLNLIRHCGCHKEGKGEHNSHTGCGCHEGQKTAVNNQWASPASAKSEIENKCGCDHKIK